MSMIRIMLVLYMFLPIKNEMVAQILLCQIYGMYQTQYALKNAGEEEEEEIERKL